MLFIVSVSNYTILTQHRIRIPNMISTRNFAKPTHAKNRGGYHDATGHLKCVKYVIKMGTTKIRFNFDKADIWCSSSNFISNKYMKTSIYNTVALMITAMFTCTLLVATRKSRGLSSWLPRNVTSNLVTRTPGPARRSWHIGTLEVVSRNEFYRMDFTLSND